MKRRGESKYKNDNRGVKGQSGGEADLHSKVYVQKPVFNPISTLMLKDK